MIKPPALCEGDRIAVVAPASPFDREDFEINSGWTSVKEALGNHNIISINGENVKLNDENISDFEKTECLKICGQKIAYFHINCPIYGNLYKSKRL